MNWMRELFSCLFVLTVAVALVFIALIGSALLEGGLP